MPVTLPRVELNCLNCNAVHYKLPCQLEKGRGKYCSRKCKYEHSRTQAETTCYYCNKLFKKFRAEFDCEKHFCSKACYNKFRRENASENTYLMSGGIHEHRIVAERHLNRKLKPLEVVHHIDENKHNNSPNNLAVFPNQTMHAFYHKFPDQIDITPYLLIKNISNVGI